MAIRYRIFQSTSDGGPVDRSVPVGDTDLLTWDSGPLRVSQTTRFAVHPYDDGTGYQDATADSRAVIILDEYGDDASGLPVAPLFLSVLPLSGGTARVTWYYPLGLPVSGFHVYCWPASGPENLTSPAGAVAASLPRDGSSHARAYSFLLTDLNGGTAYLVCVRGYNHSGEAINTGTATVTGRTAGPAPVVSLTASRTA